MLEIITQLFAAFGPLALTVMGLVVSLKPPKAEGRAHWVWLVAFILVGLPTAISTFFELRGTDTLLAQIWEHTKEGKPPTAAKEGARSVLNAGPLNRETKTTEIEAINKDDIVARASVTGMSEFVYSNHIMTKKDEDEWFGAGLGDLFLIHADRGADFVALAHKSRDGTDFGHEHNKAARTVAAKGSVKAARLIRLPLSCESVRVGVHEPDMILSALAQAALTWINGPCAESKGGFSQDASTACAPNRTGRNSTT